MWLRSKLVGGITGAVIAVASSASCVDNDGSILIIGLLAPPTSSGSGASATCTYTANVDGPFLSNGAMDIAFAQQYTPVLLLGNQLVATGNAELDRVETNNVNIEGAIVRVTSASGASLDKYTVPGTSFLFASSGGTPGLAAYGTTLISPNATAALGTFTGTKRVISYVKVFGTTTGGTHIESGEVPFSINVCDGCLVVFPTEADDPAQVKQPNCLASGTTGGTTITQPCSVGQDQPVDCRLCALTNPVCSP